MYICICHAITEGAIRNIVDDGAQSPFEVAAECGAGTGCGSCVGKICALIEETSALTPAG